MANSMSSLSLSIHQWYALYGRRNKYNSTGKIVQKLSKKLYFIQVK